jgi:hypothetical protein
VLVDECRYLLVRQVGLVPLGSAAQLDAGTEEHGGGMTGRLPQVLNPPGPDGVGMLPRPPPEVGAVETVWWAH